MNKQNFKELTQQMLYSRYPLEEEPEAQLVDLGIAPTGAARVVLAIMNKAVKSADCSCAKLLRELAGEEEEAETSNRPLGELSDDELAAMLESFSV